VVGRIREITHRYDAAMRYESGGKVGLVEVMEGRAARAGDL
jgi:hypothetical protein